MRPLFLILQLARANETVKDKENPMKIAWSKADFPLKIRKRAVPMKNFKLNQHDFNLEVEEGGSDLVEDGNEVLKESQETEFLEPIKVAALVSASAESCEEQCQDTTSDKVIRTSGLQKQFVLLEEECVLHRYTISRTNEFFATFAALLNRIWPFLRIFFTYLVLIYKSILGGDLSDILTLATSTLVIMLLVGLLAIVFKSWRSSIVPVEYVLTNKRAIKIGRTAISLYVGGALLERLGLAVTPLFAQTPCIMLAGIANERMVLSQSFFDAMQR